MNKEVRAVYENIRLIIGKAKNSAYRAINKAMLLAYWHIGKNIVEEEQKGRRRAEYGTRLLEMISSKLTVEFGKGFDITNLRRMRRFYLVYKNWETLSPELCKTKGIQPVNDGFYKLSWSHYCELLKIKDKVKRQYFKKYTINENLSVRELKRQIYSLHYERLLISKDKKALIEYDKRGSLPTISKELIKDPYVLEFLSLEEKSNYTEKELETRILNELQDFLLELGQGFSFVARQKRFTIDNEHSYIDLLFYNIYLKCYVVIELKTSKFKHKDAGQMNFYLNYVKKKLNKKGDNVPIGILLCTDKDDVYVDFAISGLSNRMFVSKYWLYLPNKEELQKKVKKLL